MKFAYKALMAAAALTASSLVAAEGGFYLAVDAGQATLSSSVNLSQTGDGSVGNGRLRQPDQNNLVASIGIGYAFNDYVAIELGYSNYGDNEDLDPAAGVITKITDIQSVNLNLLVGMPMGDNFNVYLRGGYQAVDMDARATSLTSTTTDDWNKVGYNYGFGFKLDMTENLSLRNEYLWHKFDDTDVRLDTQTITLGLVYTF